MSNGYDLGRKVVYFVIVAIVIAVIMIYMSNALYKANKEAVGSFDLLEDYILFEKVARCVSINEVLDGCLEDGIIIRLDGIEVGEGTAEKEYKKIVLHKGKLKVLTIKI